MRGTARPSDNVCHRSSDDYCPERRTIQVASEGLAISRRRPCAASACVGRSHGKWLPSTAAAFGVLGRVRELPWPPRTVEPPLPPRPWPARPLLVPRPFPGSNACTCGRSRNDRARCAQAVDRSEQSLKKCTVPVAAPRSLSGVMHGEWFTPRYVSCKSRCRDASCPRLRQYRLDDGQIRARMPLHGSARG